MVKNASCQYLNCGSWCSVSKWNVPTFFALKLWCHFHYFTNYYEPLVLLNFIVDMHAFNLIFNSLLLWVMRNCAFSNILITQKCCQSTWLVTLHTSISLVSQKALYFFKNHSLIMNQSLAWCSNFGSPMIVNIAPSWKQHVLGLASLLYWVSRTSLVMMWALVPSL